MCPQQRHCVSDCSYSDPRSAATSESINTLCFSCVSFGIYVEDKATGLWVKAPEHIHSVFIHAVLLPIIQPKHRGKVYAWFGFSSYSCHRVELSQR